MKRTSIFPKTFGGLIMFQSANIRRFPIALALIALLAGAGCAGKKTTETPTDQTNAATSEVDNMGQDSDHGGAAGLQTVHFPYDSFVLDSVAKGELKSNADILKDKSNI